MTYKTKGGEEGVINGGMRIVQEQFRDPGRGGRWWPSVAE